MDVYSGHPAVDVYSGHAALDIQLWMFTQDTLLYKIFTYGCFVTDT